MTYQQGRQASNELLLDHQRTEFVSIGFKTVLDGDTGCSSLVLNRVVLCLIDCMFYLLLRVSRDGLISNGNESGLAGDLFKYRDTLT